MNLSRNVFLSHTFKKKNHKHIFFLNANQLWSKNGVGKIVYIYFFVMIHITELIGKYWGLKYLFVFDYILVLKKILT